MHKFGVGSLACYDNLDQVGEGTYGYVYKAKDKRTNENVALKRIIFHRESAGFPLCAVREIKFLKSLQHKNIVLLRDVITSKGCEHIELTVKTDVVKSDDTSEDSDVSEHKRQKLEQQEKENSFKDIMKICGNLYLVFDFVEHDIGGLIDAKYKFPVRAVKSIMKQLFDVLDYLTEKRVMHRDIKSSNILISSRHQIKLADFGLARSSQSTDGREGRVDMTNNVVTMWYKPPELLLGAVRYNGAVDIWSAGCVLAELELGRPLFPGKTEVEQLDLICRALGTPGEDVWPGVSSMANFDSLLRNQPKYVSSLRVAYGAKLSDAATALLERVLVVDPSRRSSAKIALSHKYFTTAPLPPLDPTDLEPLNVASGVCYHEYKTKTTRRQKEEEAKRLLLDPAEQSHVPPTSATAAPNSVASAAPMISHRPPPPPPPPGTGMSASFGGPPQPRCTFPQLPTSAAPLSLPPPLHQSHLHHAQQQQQLAVTGHQYGPQQQQQGFASQAMYQPPQAFPVPPPFVGGASYVHSHPQHHGGSGQDMSGSGSGHQPWHGEGSRHYSGGYDQFGPPVPIGFANQQFDYTQHQQFHTQQPAYSAQQQQQQQQINISKGYLKYAPGPTASGIKRQHDQLL